MSILLRRIAFALLPIGQLLASVPSIADTPACSNNGYTIGFFNGVWNTPEEAVLNLAAIKSLEGDVLNGQSVNYQLFYNQTGSVSGASGLQDLAATFIQRAATIDSSGELGNRFEYFWESVTGDTTLTQKAVDIFPNLSSFFSQLYTTITTNAVAAISGLLSNPPIDATYTKHNAQLDALLAANQKMMLVAHSQGNLFVNRAYDYIAPKAASNSVKVAHIAPATSILHGSYILANIDIVINLLRSQGWYSVPVSNFPMPPSLSDASGHTLVGTYLDPTREARAKTGLIISTAMQELTQPPQCKPVAAICPDIFTQTQLAQVKPNMTVADVDQVFACQHQGDTTGSNWVVWSSPGALIRTDLDMAFVYFTNGVYLGNKVNDKYILGPVMP